jgi:hypothetical protein
VLCVARPHAPTASGWVIFLPLDQRALSTARGFCGLGAWRTLVHRLAYNDDVVAFKMGRRQGGPSRTGGRGRISRSIRNRRATQPPAHFQRNPPGRGQLAVFPRCSLDPYESRYGRFVTASPARTALKNSQRHHYMRDSALDWLSRCQAIEELPS